MGKIPFWKRILSYFKEFHVESAPSELNPHLYVSLSRGRYMLSTANAIYSHGDLYTNFRETFKKIDWNKVKGKHTLLLGVGLASIPMILEKLGHELTYVGVEIDPNVIYLASKYVLPDLHSPIHIYESDAQSFVKTHPGEKFDIICMDIFDDDTIPTAFQKKSFLNDMKALLKPKGVVFVNTLLKSDKGEISNDKLHKNLQDVFPKGEFVQVGPNAIYVSKSSYLK
jgi:spermidine synthase